MNNTEEIQQLSNDIWQACYRHRPNRDRLKQFDDRIEKVDIKAFIIHNFIYHHGTSLRELILATYTFWKDLSLNDWNEIFDGMKVDRLFEYYMAVIAKEILGIDPNYKSTRNTVISYVTTSDGNQQNGNPALFIGNMIGELRRLNEELLKEDFNLTISDLIKVNEKLMAEAKSTIKRKSFWSKK